MVLAYHFTAVDDAIDNDDDDDDGDGCDASRNWCLLTLTLIRVFYSIIFVVDLGYTNCL